MTRHLLWRPHNDVEETQTFLTHLLNSMESDETHAWIVESKEDRSAHGAYVDGRPLCQSG